jgi:hypothetical protein
MSPFWVGFILFFLNFSHIKKYSIFSWVGREQQNVGITEKSSPVFLQKYILWGAWGAES